MSRITRAALRSTAVVVAGCAASSLFIAMPAAHAASSAGGTISRGEVLARAQSWVDEGVPYNQSGYKTDANGTYREDCSGFISMAWHLTDSLVTQTLPSVSTSISFSDLQPGDALDYTAEHTFLFANWTNKSSGDFTYYAESNSHNPTHGPTSANINNSTVEGWPTNYYTALRYNNIVDDASPAVASVTGLSAGTIVSGQINLTASVSESAGTPTEADFSIDGNPVASATGSGPSYSAPFDTRKLGDGPHTLTVSAKNAAGAAGTASAPITFFVANRGTATTTTGDFNGDGKDDIAVLYNSGQDATGKNLVTLYTFLSNGATFNTPVDAWDNNDKVNGSWTWDNAKILVGDFSGTGKADIVVMYNSGQSSTGKYLTTLYKFANNGSGGFLNPVKMWDNDDSVNGSWNWNNLKPVVGDFSGTGKADIAVLYNNGQDSSGKNMLTIYKFANNGSGGVLNPVNVWDNNDKVNGSWNWNSIKPVVGKFSGTGKDDIGVLYNSGQDSSGKNMLTIYKFASNGSTFNAPVDMWDNNDKVNGSWNWNSVKAVAGDFSGTGKSDIVVMYNSGQDSSGKGLVTLYKFASNGTTLNTPVNVWDNNDKVNGSWTWDKAKLVAGKFSGTGKTDLTVMYNAGQDSSGKGLVTLYKFASNGTTLNTPVNAWDNNDTVNGSWNWFRADLA
ncbi:Ig-like domain-containing protein [Kitasatospora aureofaciens]|uniref:Ig-like domain-containing protein n=1 Tax=Kitasatospora aureofaciens TaxID=1894 RepID=UPI0037CAA231